MRLPLGPQPRGSLADLLRLEALGGGPLDGDRFRTTQVFPDAFPLYGGQLLAQALVAAGRTVADDRAPHALHATFLRPGRSEVPTDYVVHHDRDGKSFSARRVVATQRGEVLMHLTASFHHEEGGVDRQLETAPPAPPPGECAPFEIPRLWSMHGRLPPQPWADLDWPVRFWARLSDDEMQGTALLAAAVQVYLSDISTGLSALRPEDATNSSSLDHAMWFHRSTSSEWLLVELVPHTASGGRGWYTGSLFSLDGTLVASFAQEALFR